MNTLIAYNRFTGSSIRGTLLVSFPLITADYCRKDPSRSAKSAGNIYDSIFELTN
ncbi:MAG TPA: hypothetical protein VIK07_00805 [Bacteroidales bacterium]